MDGQRFVMGRSLTSLLVGATLLAGPVNREALAAPAAVRMGHEACPALFGAPKRHARNARRRARLLLMVVDEPSGVTIAHTNPRWRKPRPLRIGGLELSRTDPPGAPDHALVRVSGQLARSSGCAPGDYLVQQDDALGRKARVLEVLDDGLLIEHGSRLAYLATPEGEVERWLMAWSVPGVELRGVPKGRAVRRAPPPKPPKRRPPKRRPPKRRR